MILSLFAVLAAIALLLVIIGFVFTSHTELSIVGFALLFILSVILLNGGLVYVDGSTVNTTVSYSGSNPTNTYQVITDTYTPFDDASSHRIGWALSVISVTGVVGVFWSLRRSK